VQIKPFFFQLAEGVGFEPTFAKKAKAVFKTATISHSVTPPETKFQFLLKIMAALDVKLALFFITFTAGVKPQRVTP
jgi:hypothetical protein